MKPKTSFNKMDQIISIQEWRQTESDQDVLEYMLNLMESGKDIDLYKINPFRIANLLGKGKLETVRAFLFGTRLGIFDLNWDIHCPSCWGIPETERHMMGLKKRVHCGLCTIEWDIDFETQVEVTFTLNPAIRKLEIVDFKDRDFNQKMEFFDEILPREKRDFTLGACIFPEKPFESTVDFPPGKYSLWLPEHLDLKAAIEVLPEKSETLQKLDFEVKENGEVIPSQVKIKSGKVALFARSYYPNMNGFLIAENKQHHNWVSAHYISNLQDFKNLFSGEFLSPEASFSIKNVTLMFTDLKSSTEMYEKVGDNRAFLSVKEHFKVMGTVIQEYSGGIVKTIGDAVMASFPDNLKGVQCALAIQKVFIENRKNGTTDLELKMGIHRGPAIAVSLNGQNDYFGRTVNMAARIQGVSEASELVLSKEVFEDPEVVEYLKKTPYKIREKEAQLKGIHGPIRLKIIQE